MNPTSPYHLHVDSPKNVSRESSPSPTTTSPRKKKTKFFDHNRILHIKPRNLFNTSQDKTNEMGQIVLSDHHESYSLSSNIAFSIIVSKVKVNQEECSNPEIRSSPSHELEYSNTPETYPNSGNEPEINTRGTDYSSSSDSINITNSYDNPNLSLSKKDAIPVNFPIHEKLLETTDKQFRSLNRSHPLPTRTMSSITQYSHSEKPASSENLWSHFSSNSDKNLTQNQSPTSSPKRQHGQKRRISSETVTIITGNSQTSFSSENLREFFTSGNTKQYRQHKVWVPKHSLRLLTERYPDFWKHTFEHALPKNLDNLKLMFTLQGVSKICRKLMEPLIAKQKELVIEFLREQGIEFDDSCEAEMEWREIQSASFEIATIHNSSNKKPDQQQVELKHAIKIYLNKINKLWDRVKNITFLKIKGKDLKELPFQLVLLAPYLVEVNFSGNDLKEIPSFLWYCKKLTQVNLNINPIAKAPSLEEIAKVPFIQKIELLRTKIITAPLELKDKLALEPSVIFATHDSPRIKC